MSIRMPELVPFRGFRRAIILVVLQKTDQDDEVKCKYQ